MSNRDKHIPLADEDFDDLLSISEISSISSSDDSLSPPPPTIPIRKVSLIERRGLQIDGLKIGEKGYSKMQIKKIIILLTSIAFYEKGHHLQIVIFLLGHSVT